MSKTMGEILEMQVITPDSAERQFAAQGINNARVREALAAGYNKLYMNYLSNGLCPEHARGNKKQNNKLFKQYSHSSLSQSALVLQRAGMLEEAFGAKGKSRESYQRDILSGEVSRYIKDYSVKAHRWKKSMRKDQRKALQHIRDWAAVSIDGHNPKMFSPRTEKQHWITDFFNFNQKPWHECANLFVKRGETTNLLTQSEVNFLEEVILWENEYKSASKASGEAGGEFLSALAESSMPHRLTMGDLYKFWQYSQEYNYEWASAMYDWNCEN